MCINSHIIYPQGMGLSASQPAQSDGGRYDTDALWQEPCLLNGAETNWH